MEPDAIPPFNPTPGRAERLRPLDFAILGLLGEQPSHGYDLQPAFSESADLGAVIRVEPPTLYSALKELASTGLIEGREVRRGARPPRTEYRLTDLGERTFGEWLRTPVRRLREVRLDFLLKLYFASRRSRSEAQHLVSDQLMACRGYLTTLEEWAAGLPEDSWLNVVAESRLVAARATLAWLADYALRLDSGSPRSAGRGAS